MNIQQLIEKYESRIKNIQLKPRASIKTTIYEVVIKDLKQLDEPQKVTIPQFVADHLKKSKEVGRDLQDAMNSSTILEEVDLWLYTDNNMDVFARAWLDGYEVEKEKRYLVKIKGIDNDFNFLNHYRNEDYWLFSSKYKNTLYQTHHTRKELESAGFGWVFDCPGVEIEEVEG
jgi:hypothetical protein